MLRTIASSANLSLLSLPSPAEAEIVKTECKLEKYGDNALADIFRVNFAKILATFRSGAKVGILSFSQPNGGKATYGSIPIHFYSTALDATAFSYTKQECRQHKSLDERNRWMINVAHSNNHVCEPGVLSKFRSERQERRETHFAKTIDIKTWSAARGLAIPQLRDSITQVPPHLGA